VLGQGVFEVTSVGKVENLMFEVSMVKPSFEVNISHTPGADTSLPLPTYATDGAAGMDVRANLPKNGRTDGVDIGPGERKLVGTGLVMEIPVGFEMQVRPRSGLALKSGITLANSPGTIDSDYRGEVGIILVNLSDTSFHIAHGDRIAQLVFAPVARCEWRIVGEATETTRGSGGFGSTGI